MGWRKVYACTIHGNALPCPKCRRVNAQAKANGTAPHTCPKSGCGGTVRGGVCPDPRGVH